MTISCHIVVPMDGRTVEVVLGAVDAVLVDNHGLVLVAAEAEYEIAVSVGFSGRRCC